MRRIHFFGFVLILSVLVLSGCSGSNKGEPSEAPNGGTSKPVDSNASGTKPAPKTIPDSLLTDGALYLGAPFEKSLQYEVKGLPAGPASGSQEIEVVEVTDTKAVISAKWTGGLVALGSQKFEITPNGVTQVETEGQKMTPPVLYLPAKIGIGTNWSNDTKIEQLQTLENVTLTSKSKVVREETVKTPAGDFTCFVVQETGKMKATDLDVNSEATYWIAKGVGLVKARISQKGKGPAGAISVTLEINPIKPEG